MQPVTPETVVGAPDGEVSDDAITAMAALLLAMAEQDVKTSGKEEKQTQLLTCNTNEPKPK